MAKRAGMKISFTKMHGCGNDFVVFDGRKTSFSNWEKVSKKVLARQFGVGGDQMLILLESKSADAKMGVSMDAYSFGDGGFSSR